MAALFQAVDVDERGEHLVHALHRFSKQLELRGAPRFLHHVLQHRLYAPDRLQGLAQIVARGGQKSGFDFVRLKSGVGFRGQPVLELLAVGHVANGRDHELTTSIVHRAQADFHRKFAAVASSPEQIQSRAHCTNLPKACVMTPVSDVPGAQALRHEIFDFPTDQIVRGIPKQLERARVRVQDRAEHVDDEHRIGCGLECAAGQMKRELDRRGGGIGHAIHSCSGLGCPRVAATGENRIRGTLGL